MTPYSEAKTSQFNSSRTGMARAKMVKSAVYADAGESMSKIRVLLADDHEAILAKVRGLLGEDFDVVTTVNNGQDAVAEVKRLSPDVLVMDISMPVLNGLEAVSQLRSAGSVTKVVMLTVHEDPEIISAALHQGASGYVVKEHVATDLIPAIQECLRGGSYVPGGMHG